MKNDVKSIRVVREMGAKWTDGGEVSNAGYFELDIEGDFLLRMFGSFMDDIIYGSSCKFTIMFEVEREG